MVIGAALDLVPDRASVKAMAVASAKVLEEEPVAVCISPAQGSIRQHWSKKYTDDARRQRIQGNVVLEIVVRSDGSVGAVKVRRSLGGGLDQRAIEAVRQWRFNPAKRHGTPVDVAVEIEVEFKLR